MNLQHTSGPWYVKKRNGQKAATICKHDGSGERIARMNPGQSEANAELIAAAPDMLAALEAAREVLEHYGITRGHPVSMQAARVIAKARGL